MLEYKDGANTPSLYRPCHIISRLDFILAPPIPVHILQPQLIVTSAFLFQN